MDFAQLQMLISRGIANAEAGEEPDLDIDRSVGMVMSQPQYSSNVEEIADLPPRAPQAETGRCNNAAPRSKMAELRAAAEERAYSGQTGSSSRTTTPTRRVSASTAISATAQYSNGHAGNHREVHVEQTPSAYEDAEGASSIREPSRNRMSAIRAIAERRAYGNRESSTTRVRTPVRTPRSDDDMEHEGRSAPRTPRDISTGAYRPNHVYGSRNQHGGGGLLE